MDNLQEKNGHKSDKGAKRAPAYCLIELAIFAFVGVTFLIGVGKILEPYLSNLANSMFGMGLK